MAAEVWKFVVGFPEYKVSSIGRVRRVVPSKRNYRLRILKPWLNNKGYEIVGMQEGGRRLRAPVHRIVCLAFHGKPPTGKNHAAHWDGNSRNNCFKNLRWATRSENMEDARRHGTMALGSRHGRTTKPHRTPRGEKHGHAKLTEKQVLTIRAQPKVVGSGRRLARRYKVSPAIICNIRARKIWVHI